MWSLCLALLLAASPQVASAESVELRWQQAKSSMDRLDFKGALRVLAELVEDSSIPPGPRAQMLVALAITHFNLNRPDEAGAALARAVAWDAQVRFPARFATPKLQAMLDAQTQAQARSTAAPLPRPLAPAEPTPPGQPPPEVVRSGQPNRRSAWVPAAGLGALFVVGLGAGIGLALSSRSLATEIQARPHPSGELAALERGREARAVGAWVSYGVAGAAALGAVGMMLWGGPSAPAVLAAPYSSGDGAGLWVGASLRLE